MKTSLTVGDGQTIVMGGLMTDQKKDRSSGVPFVRSIPIIGALFGQNYNTRDKEDLMLFITPRLIVNLADVDSVTKEFKSKVNNIKF